MRKRANDVKSMCLRLRPEEYAHLQALARACGSTPHGTVRLLLRQACVVRPIAVQPPELMLTGNDQTVVHDLSDDL